MRKVFFFLIVALFLNGCVTTKGNWDKNNKIQEPYIFIYDGSTKQLAKDLKIMLVENGFGIDTDDQESGILMSTPKLLAEDERLNADFALAMMGTHINKQNGVISFIYKQEESKSTLKMYCKLQLEGKSHESAFKDRDISTETNILPQGHPLPMKMKALILKNPKFSL